MHLGTLPGLLLSLAWGLFGTVPSDNVVATGAHLGLNNTALYSVMAQAEPTVVTGTATLEATIAAATSVVTVTGTVTGTIAPLPTATVIPLPTAAPAGGGMQLNPFDWNFLTSAPTEPKIGPFAWIMLALCLGLVAAGIYAYRVLRPRWKNNNTVLYRAAARFGQPAIWIGVIGLFFLLFRAISLDFFNLRIWLYLVGLAVVGLAVWMFYWYRTSYPAEKAKYQKTQKAKQYAPAGGKGPVRVTGPSAPVAPPKGRARRKK